MRRLAAIEIATFTRTHARSRWLVDGSGLDEQRRGRGRGQHVLRPTRLAGPVRHHAQAAPKRRAAWS